MYSVSKKFVLQGEHKLRPAYSYPNLNVARLSLSPPLVVEHVEQGGMTKELQYNDGWGQIVRRTLVSLVLWTTAALRALKLYRAHINALINRSIRLKETRRPTKDIIPGWKTGRRTYRLYI